MQSEVRKYSAKELADILLNDYWDGIKFPTISSKMLDGLKITLATADFNDDNVDGLLRLEKGKLPEIVIKKLKNGLTGRALFTIAHEIGHYMDIKYNFPEELEQDVVRVDYRKSDDKSPKELFANEFAGCLLMPAHIIASMVNKNYTKGDMIMQLGVSENALDVRLRNLGYE